MSDLTVYECYFDLRENTINCKIYDQMYIAVRPM